MELIEEVRREREDLAKVLKKHKGIRRIVEDLYPDRAHFIYELLQNAEDTGATEAHFSLSPTGLSFEHNGRAFEQRDVFAITDIGEGTKADDDDKIGRFGVGFKAVFAYSETPHIWSPTLSFKITDLVLPSTLDSIHELGNRTRFLFPFNNPEKNADQAYAEIETGLNELAETTLLFLSNLESIRWQIDGSLTGEVLRVKHSENHVEILKEINGRTTTSSHFLMFDEPADRLEKQRVSAAFSLDFLPNVSQFDSKKPLAKQLKVVPATVGRVAVYFPAEKETSGLRFHLHAPFVPELSRASIKESPANEPLLRQLASLTAACLHKIRDLKLLSPEFLAVLPSERLAPRYEGIRDAIISEMNSKPLTPTHTKSHAAAKFLLQAKASLKELLSEEDIEYLVDYDDEPPQWAIGATQKNNDVDRFLAALAITKWDIDDFVAVLRAKTSGNHWTGHYDEFVRWLSRKPVAWHQQLYSIFYEELSSGDSLGNVRDLKIVRLLNGSYRAGSECFFPSEGAEDDEDLPRVDGGVFKSGRSKAQQEKAEGFLRQIGVRDVGEAEQIEAILKKRYAEADGNFKPRKQDLKRFIAFWEKQPDKARLFQNYFIFELEDDKWGKPCHVFIDEPLQDTGLKAYYDAIGPERFALKTNGKESKKDVERLVAFAKAVGIQTGLAIQERSTAYHRDLLQLQQYRSMFGAKRGTDVDWDIPHLRELLSLGTKRISQLIWKTMTEADPQVLEARFAPKQAYLARYTQTAKSSLVLTLQESAWIPQEDGAFVRPADASRDALPTGFAFDTGWPWLKAVGFGEVITKKSEEHRRRQALAKELLGSDSEEVLELAQRFAALPREVQLRSLADCEREASAELPESESPNPERRAERVRRQALDADERLTEERRRSVQVGLESIKQEAATYLRQQYTNRDGEMVCQICKKVLPFKLDDGSYYLEKTKFLGLRKPHYQNYLALCPNHSAMFQHANGSADLMAGMFIEMGGNELEVVLAQKDFSIYFTKTHIADLKSIIEAEEMLKERAS